jgi:F-type H+-transporting ATPase subunit alpha
LVLALMKLDLVQCNEQLVSQLQFQEQFLLLLKQKQFSPLPFEEQTASIFAGTNGYLDGIPVNDVTRYEEAMLADLRANHAGILKTIRDSRDFSDDSKKALMAALEKFTKNFA